MKTIKKLGCEMAFIGMIAVASISLGVETMLAAATNCVDHVNGALLNGMSKFNEKHFKDKTES